MKVLCFIDSLGAGGAQRQLVNLGIGLKSRGHDVIFLTYYDEPFYDESLGNEKITIFKIIEKKPFQRVRKIRQFINGNNFDVVISFLETPSFIATLSGFPRRKWKLIVGERSSNPKIFKSPKLILYRYFHLFADQVVANSYENIKMIKKINPLLRPKKMSVIYNGIDFSQWSPSTEKKVFDLKKTHVIVAASHQKLKNLNGLILAVNNLPQELRDKIVIDWFGGKRANDDSKNEGVKLINRLGLNSCFNFYDEINDVKSEMEKYDFIGLFSFYEGLPNVLCEGMALGKPIIASNVSDNHLLLGNNGGYLFDPHSTHELTKVLILALKSSSQDRLRMGNYNLSKAKELFDFDYILDEYEKFFI